MASTTPEVFEVEPDHDPSRPRLLVRWHPVAKARGTVLVVHGYGEHSGRYAHVFAALGQAGYACMGIDYRGFGRAQGRRAYVRRYAEYLDDVQWAVDECQRRSAHPPVLLGHSQGGLVAALLTVERAPRLRGLVLSSPALRFAVRIPPWKHLVARLASRVWPTLGMPATIDPELLTHDPDVLEALRQDPLIVRSATVRWYTESRAAQQRVLASSDRLTLPVLFLVAGADGVVDREVTHRFFTQCAAVDKTFREYAGARHEIFNELPPVRERALADLIGWLDQRA